MVSESRRRQPQARAIASATAGCLLRRRKSIPGIRTGGPCLHTAMQSASRGLVVRDRNGETAAERGARPQANSPTVWECRPPSDRMETKHALRAALPPFGRVVVFSRGTAVVLVFLVAYLHHRARTIRHLASPLSPMTPMHPAIAKRGFKRLRKSACEHAPRAYACVGTDWSMRRMPSADTLDENGVQPAQSLLQTLRV
jgi:hypothetical protein